MKICCNCHKELTSDQFYNDKYKPDGKKPRCKKCELLYIDRDNRKKYEQEYWNKNNIRKKQIKNKCYQKNKEKYHKKRQERYNDSDFISMRRMYDQIRRARTIGDLKKEEIKELIDTSYHCYYCGKELQNKKEIDHKIPLSRGGLNTIKNLVITCVKCNRSKGSKTDAEYFEYLGII